MTWPSRGASSMRMRRSDQLWMSVQRSSGKPSSLAVSRHGSWAARSGITSTSPPSGLDGIQQVGDDGAEPLLLAPHRPGREPARDQPALGQVRRVVLGDDVVLLRGPPRAVALPGDEGGAVALHLQHVRVAGDRPQSVALVPEQRLVGAHPGVGGVWVGLVEAGIQQVHVRSGGAGDGARHGGQSAPPGRSGGCHTNWMERYLPARANSGCHMTDRVTRGPEVVPMAGGGPDALDEVRRPAARNPAGSLAP